MNSAARHFDILAIDLSVIHNPMIVRFPIKLFLNLYLVIFLDTTAKLLFPCNKFCSIFNLHIFLSTINRKILIMFINIMFLFNLL